MATLMKQCAICIPTVEKRKSMKQLHQIYKLLFVCVLFSIYLKNNIINESIILIDFLLLLSTF